MQYRREIDGLRAVAVIPVILFHAGFTVFSGGYVGVDIFFVISGYLITTILINELEQGNFSILRFYERRARRILPALFFVMLFCIPFAWMWMLPSQLEDFSQSLVAVGLFVSNILFWRESGYFGAASETKPLLHTWSLAVEEQYYMLFPIFLMLFWRFGRNPVFYSIIAISVLSLLLSELGWRKYPGANFYLAPTRAWELFAGSIAAFMVTAKPRKPSTPLSTFGLALIVFSIFFYDNNTPFPSVYALAPVGGTALIILYGTRGTWVASLLSHKSFVGIGLISYSAYLWHQPLFAFARLRSLAPPEHWVMLALAAASLGLAYLTWRFVENPFRKRRAPLRDPFLASQRALFGVAGLVGAGFIAIGLYGDSRNGLLFGASYNPAQTATIAYANYDKDGLYRRRDCFLERQQTSADIKDTCSTAQNDILIIGDSYAAALSVGLRERFSTSQITASSCPPLATYASSKRPNCAGLNRFSFALVSQQLPKIIVLHSNWKSYPDDQLENLPTTIEALQKSAPDSQIIVVGGAPRWLPNLPEQLAKYDDPLAQSRYLKANTAEIEHADEILRRRATQMGVKFVSLLDPLCDNALCLSTVRSADQNDQTYVPLAWDPGHLTYES
ncbi:MAG: acyltransferase family protein [Rhodobacterales bacterium]|nr:acyltransferase family protein [Rhodobacterales bacterium]